MKVIQSVQVCILGIGALGAAHTSQAVIINPSAPSGMLTVQTGGQTATIPVEVFGTEKGWGFQVAVETAEYKLVGDGILNSDPVIAYGIAVTDFGAPSVFGFVFGTPIVPTGPGTTVNSSIVGGLTDLTGDGVAITPVGQPLVQTSQVGFPLTPMGVDVGPAFSAPPGPPGALHTYGSHSAGPSPGPTGIWTFLSVTVAFGLSGGGDIAALTGFAQVETATRVPDSGPGGTGLVMLGLLLFAGALYRRPCAAIGSGGQAR